MNNFFLCHTYYQLITAIQFRLSEFEGDYSIIALSDHSKNAEMCVEELRKTKLFDEAYYIKTRYVCGPNIKFRYKIKGIIDDVIGNLYEIDQKNIAKQFDRFIYYNDNHASLAIYAALSSKNRDIECIRIEEGLGSYILGFKKDKKAILSQGARRVIGKKLLYEETKAFYCYQPNLYPGKLIPRQIPQITPNSPIVDVLDKIFLKPGIDYRIAQKYIFLGSPYDKDGEVPIGEHDLVKHIADFVGRENIIVKSHPRDFSDDYSAMGISLYPHSAIPWEALQLIMDFSDKVLLTSVSSSVMSLNMTLEHPIKTFYLYKLTRARDNKLARVTIDMMDVFKERFDFNPEEYNIHIVDRLEQILE